MCARPTSTHQAANMKIEALKSKSEKSLLLLPQRAYTMIPRTAMISKALLKINATLILQQREHRQENLELPP